MGLMDLFQRKKTTLLSIASVMTFLNSNSYKNDWSKNTLKIVNLIAIDYKIKVKEEKKGEPVNYSYNELSEYDQKMFEFLDSLENDIKTYLAEKNFSKARKQLSFMINLQKLSKRKDIIKKIREIRANIQLLINNSKSK